MIDRIVLSLSLVAGLAGCSTLGRPPEPGSATSHQTLSIMQGVTSADRTRFSVVVPKRETLTYAVRGGGARRVVASRRVPGVESEFAVDQLFVDGLRPGVEYELIVTQGDEVWDHRRFRALDVAKPRARVAVISCMDSTMGADARRMWPQVLRQAPDALLLIGDNVYADHVKAGPFWKKPAPADLWRRYVETRRELPLYFAETLVPVVATWDDHDFASDNSDRTYPYREESKRTFLAFFPQAEVEPGFERGPGVASWWSAFGVDWAITDDRYFRSPDKAGGADETHFGPEQEHWLIDHLTRAPRPILLVSGDQFFGGYHSFESYEGSHPRSFARALSAWRQSAKTPILFVSGDRHLSEIMKVPQTALGYPTFEVTSSGIHASVFADAFIREPSPHQLVGVAGRLNYSILELMRTEPNLLRVSVEAFAPNDALLYQRTLTVKR